jgi:hypothetical protein
MKPSAVHFSPATQHVTFSYPDAAIDTSIAGERLGALLVSYCITAGIPLPRYSVKAVRVDAGAIIVMCRTHFNDPPPIQ